MARRIDHIGFIPPVHRRLGRERRTVAVAELIAGTGLIIGTLIAATAISAGIARANAAGNVIDHESGLFAIALLLGLLFIGMGALSGWRHGPRN
jgi:hypothetical protein